MSLLQMAHHVTTLRDLGEELDVHCRKPLAFHEEQDQYQTHPKQVITVARHSTHCLLTNLQPYCCHMHTLHPPSPHTHTPTHSVLTHPHSHPHSHTYMHSHPLSLFTDPYSVSSPTPTLLPLSSFTHTFCPLVYIQAQAWPLFAIKSCVSPSMSTSILRAQAQPRAASCLPHSISSLPFPWLHHRGICPSPACKSLSQLLS